MREVKVKSVIPIYSIGAAWLLYILIFPLYRWFDFVVAAIMSALVYAIFSKLIPPKVTMIEEPIDTGNQELDEALTAGKEYIKELRGLQQLIVNSDMKQKIQGIEGVSGKILTFIEKHPNKVRQVRQLINYYLPTTIKLIKNYIEFEKQTAGGGHVADAMEKISGILDKVTEAFNRMLDDLYSDKAMDATIEIEVLEKMIQQEGLEMNPFQNRQ